MAKTNLGETVNYETWYNRELGTGRHSRADTEEQARAVADEFKTGGHPNIEILKITTSVEVLDSD